jgi:hypothetical protein
MPSMELAIESMRESASRTVINLQRGGHAIDATCSKSARVVCIDLGPTVPSRSTALSLRVIRHLPVRRD